MAEAQGLSSTVLQAPDIIGEQRQADALKQQQAMQQAKFQESLKPKPFKFGDKDKLGQLPAEFSVADMKMSDAVRKYIEDNAYELSKGNPQYTNQLGRFIDKYNALKKQADLSVEEFRNDVEGLAEEQRNEFGFAGYLMDADDFGQNLVIGDDLSLAYQTPEGTKNIEDAQVLFNPRSYYYKPVQWFDLATKGAVATKNSIENQGRTVTQSDLNKIRRQIGNTIDLNLVSNPDALASMINDYSNEVLGTQLSPEGIKNVINGTGVSASTDNGSEIITLENVTQWAKDKAAEQVGARVGITTREEQGKDSGSGYDNVVKQTRPRTSSGNIADYKAKDGAEIDVKKTRFVTPPKRTRVYTISSDDEQILSDVTSIGLDDNGNLIALVIGQPEGGVKQKSSIILNDEQANTIARDIGLPSGKDLRDLINDAYPKADFTTSTETQETEVESDGSQEEPQNVDDIFNYKVDG